MNNYKTIIQDVLHLILVVGLVGMGLSSQLQPLVSPQVYQWTMLILAGLLVLVYQADIIFGFPNTNVPIPPTITPSITPTTPSV